MAGERHSPGVSITVVCSIAILVLFSSGVTVLGFEPSLPSVSTLAKVGLAYPNLDVGLNQVVLAKDGAAEAKALGYRVLDARINVNIIVRTGQAAVVADWLRSNGAVNVLSAWDQVEAFVTPDLLALLSSHPDVKYIRQPSYAVEPEPPDRNPYAKAGLVTSEGVAALHADRWHAAGFTGQGVKVGVIDGALGHYWLLFGTDLPSAGDVEFQDFTGFGTDHWEMHGVACAEVIYDVAPGLERMYLAQAGTPVEIANAAAWMQSNGVKVISMSSGWLSWGPGDGTGELADVVNAFASAGGVWVNSAGNSALAHWMGYWRDDNHDGWLDFEPGREIDWVTEPPYDLPVQIWPGYPVNASMVYSQWGTTVTDLDLCLVFWDGQSPSAQVVQCAGTDNTQSGFPTEDLYFNTPALGIYGFAVRHVSGPTNLALEFFNRFDGEPLQFRTAVGSITPPCDAGGALCVAAVDVNTYDLEPYSSWGPTNAPGGWIIGGRIKPDLSSFANVSTVVYGPGVFNGTSSACPHVAGAAALVWSAYPDMSNAMLRSFLEFNCVDQGHIGKDVSYGWGRLLLPDPPGN